MGDTSSLQVVGGTFSKCKAHSQSSWDRGRNKEHDWGRARGMKKGLGVTQDKKGWETSVMYANSVDYHPWNIVKDDVCETFKLNT